MTRAPLATLVVLVWATAPAAAHRLDEYLQDTTFSLEPRRVAAQIRLTPGVAVLHTVLATIDTNADGVISTAEEQAYARWILRDLSLSIDGHPLQLQLRSATFPTLDDMKEGVGEILLALDAPLPPGGPDRHLAFENRHHRGIAAYLVNCLVPTNPAIHVKAQTRSYDQSLYQLDYTQPSTRPSPPPPASSSTLRLWLAADALALLACLTPFVRRRRASPPLGTPTNGLGGTRTHTL